MGFQTIDENLMYIINNLMLFCQKYYTIFIVAGQALGAVMAIFVVAGEAYQVMVKQKGFDVLAIIRPIAIALVLAYWIPFVGILGSVPRIMESYGQGIFQTEHMSIQTLREQRTEAAKDVKKRADAARAAAEMAEKQISNGNIFDRLLEMGTDMMGAIQEQLASFALIIEASANQFLEHWIQKLGEFFWQIQIYLLFFIKEAFAGILVITGPITFGLSILPTWKDAWSQWVAKYISVLLYGFVGYFMLAMALQLIKYGIQMDIDVLIKANSSSEAYSAYAQSSMVTAIFHVVCLIVGGLSLKTVPEIVTWIIPTSSAHAANHFVGGVYEKLGKRAGQVGQAAVGIAK
ncbi:hypothetical protein FACS189451_03760 [Bacteroidia bacterium]|nr:hypothetical protein FACS189446_1560 [Bacteroidia bacterium]GHT61541.1 hypothetical protein FACS189451_03760 [Bacteroidia bacterium]